MQLKNKNKTGQLSERQQTDSIFSQFQNYTTVITNGKPWGWSSSCCRQPTATRWTRCFHSWRSWQPTLKTAIILATRWMPLTWPPSLHQTYCIEINLMKLPSKFSFNFKVKHFEFYSILYSFDIGFVKWSWLGKCYNQEPKLKLNVFLSVNYQCKMLLDTIPIMTAYKNSC